MLIDTDSFDTDFIDAIDHYSTMACFAWMGSIAEIKRNLTHGKMDFAQRLKQNNLCLMVAGPFVSGKILD